jgi:glycosyltransferase involved in cell wall biosynthesis
VIEIDIVIPSYRSKELTSLCIRSFEKYKGDFNFRYIVVENSDDISYKEEVLSLAKNIIWIQNPTDLKTSAANAIGIEKGLPHVESEYVFICHNDVVACHENWLNCLVKNIKENDCVAASFVLDNIRINALHISGILVKSKIAKSVSMYPIYENGKQILDVGDSITQYCRDNNLKYFSCRNTHNDDSCEELCAEPYNSLHHIDRALDSENNVIFLHLGRGTEKTLGTYWKSGRLTLGGWINFVETHILT